MVSTPHLSRASMNHFLQPLQKKLIEARLRTASQRNYEACGFRAAYPKLELARG